MAQTHMEGDDAYPDTDDEISGPSSTYLPPRPCPATQILMSLMCPGVTSPKRTVLDLVAALPSLPLLPATGASTPGASVSTSMDLTSRVSCSSVDSDSWNEETFADDCDTATNGRSEGHVNAPLVNGVTAKGPPKDGECSMTKRQRSKKASPKKPKAEGASEALVQAMKTGQLALQRARAMKTDPSVSFESEKTRPCRVAKTAGVAGA